MRHHFVFRYQLVRPLGTETDDPQKSRNWLFRGIAEARLVLAGSVSLLPPTVTDDVTLDFATIEAAKRVNISQRLKNRL
jgi:hypothetical protein